MNAVIIAFGIALAIVGLLWLMYKRKNTSRDVITGDKT